MKLNYKRMMEQVTLTDEARAVVLSKLDQPRRRSRHGLYWAAAAVLTVVLIAAGAILFSGGTPVDPNGPMAGVDPGVTDTDPAPIVSEYDIFSDPNVLWGSEEDAALQQGGMKGPSKLLCELIQSANGENLIVFKVDFLNLNGVRFQYPEIDPDRLIYDESFDPHGVLSELIEQYVSAETVSELSVAWCAIHNYAENYPFQYEDYTLAHNKMTERYFQIRNSLWLDWEGRGYADGLTSEEWELFDAELDRLLEEDVEYQKHRDVCASYEGRRDQFQESWQIQWAGYVRGIFEEMGFAAVYDMKSLTQDGFDVENALVFVGSAKQIQRLIDGEGLEPDESMYLCTTEKEESMVVRY